MVKLGLGGFLKRLFCSSHNPTSMEDAAIQIATAILLKPEDGRGNTELWLTDGRGSKPRTEGLVTALCMFGLKATTEYREPLWVAVLTLEQPGDNTLEKNKLFDAYKYLLNKHLVIIGNDNVSWKNEPSHKVHDAILNVVLTLCGGVAPVDPIYKHLEFGIKNSPFEKRLIALMKKPDGEYFNPPSPLSTSEAQILTNSF